MKTSVGDPVKSLGTTPLSVSLLIGGHPTHAGSTTSQEGVAVTSPTALGWEASRSVEKTRVAWRRETKRVGGLGVCG